MGCGTGLSGAALAEAGFTTIDGSDLSPGMLDKARALGVYRDLWLPDDLPDRRYDAVAAVGVIGPGAAPLDLFDTCLEPSSRPAGCSFCRSTITRWTCRNFPPASPARSRRARLCPGSRNTAPTCPA